MTREDAAELLELFRCDNPGLPPVSPAVLANAYLKMLVPFRRTQRNATTDNGNERQRP